MDYESERSGSLRRCYFWLLRRANVAGWEAAKLEYWCRERELGRREADVRGDLEIFEQLNAQARARGIDPLLAQRRRDLYTGVARPCAAALACIWTASAAASGLALLPAIGGAVAVTVAGLALGRAVVLWIVDG